MTKWPAMNSSIFGPVPSRRLGRSLGVDLVPFKTCTYDCIYCQLGRTTNKTTERKEWVPLSAVVDELKSRLSCNPDYITLSGSGEPTLYSRIGELIDQVKTFTEVPVAVLTNGSLLWSKEVRQQLIAADLVIPSLDAGSHMFFSHINQPHHDITFEMLLEGLIKFRQEYSGQYWLEVFLVGGVNTTSMEVEKISQCITKISPDRVQLNTVTRPPARGFAQPVREERLQKVATILGQAAEVIADFTQIHKEPDFHSRREDILEMIKRRPCSVDDITKVTRLHRNEVLKYLQELSIREETVSTHQGKTVYYQVRR